ncbi:MAG: vWA domain-containing protein [Chloroflexota bacterium]
MSNYTIPATSKTPALIIYLLDVSGSMNHDCGSKTRIDVVTESLQKVAVRMVQRSTKGTIVAPRYRIAMYAYSNEVVDLLGGVKTIDELANMGVPQLTTLNMTDTAAAFAEAERLLEAELPNIQHCPAPLVCHMTDGEFNGDDPAPIAKRIMEMAVPDGNVLVENIFIRSGILKNTNVEAWPGISSVDELSDEYAQALFEMSSPMPDSYHSVMQEFGYGLNAGVNMFFPGEEPDFVELGFAMSGATPVTGG